MSMHIQILCMAKYAHAKGQLRDGYNSDDLQHERLALAACNKARLPVPASLRHRLNLVLEFQRLYP